MRVPVRDKLNAWSGVLGVAIIILMAAGGIATKFVVAGKQEVERLSTSYEHHVDDEDIHMPLAVAEMHFVTHPIFESTISAVQASQEDFKEFLERERVHTDRQFKEIKNMIRDLPPR